ncbi:hypothetical protein ES703_76853 [subsurface metagenome]
MVLEIGGERFGRGRIDGTGLRRIQLDVVDRALLVLEAGDGVEQRLGRLETGRDRAGDLPAQRELALLGEVALLGKAGLAQHRLEAGRIELAVETLEVGIAGDHAHGFGVGLAEPHAAGFLIEGGFRHDLLQYLAVEAEQARLLLGQRPAELTAHLLQAIIVDLAEGLDRNLGAADLGELRLAEPLEDVGDAPDAKTDDQNAHDNGHDGLAEPV